MTTREKIQWALIAVLLTSVWLQHLDAMRLPPGAFYQCPLMIEEPVRPIPA